MVRLIESLANNRSEHHIENTSSGFWKSFTHEIEKLDPKDILSQTLEIIKNRKYSSGSSILHENGFSKLSIYKDQETELQIRLHFWPKGGEDTSIHNHRWNFISFLLHGNMTFTNWSIKEKTNSQREVYVMTDADKEYKKQKARLYNCRCDTHSKYVLSERAHHYCEKDVFHSGMANKASITLMITGKPTKEDTQVIFHDEKRKSIFRKPLTTDQACGIISESLELLEI